MARSIHTAENIIEAGEKLKSADGGTVEAWEVFKNLGIPELRQNPKFVVADDPEIVRHLIAE